ncbi:hypothetical protein LINPERHAP2_LOCUS38564 [Linum perenne]
MDLNGKIVHHPRRNTIRRGLIDANFHGLLDMQVQLINKELTQLLITSYEPDARRFVFPNGEVLTVQASDVGRVYGLVSTGERITVQSCPAVGGINRDEREQVIYVLHMSCFLHATCMIYVLL